MRIKRTELLLGPSRGLSVSVPGSNFQKSGGVFAGDLHSKVKLLLELQVFHVF